MERNIMIFPGVYLTMVQTDQFKTGCFSINFLRQLSQREAAYNALLPNVLLRGTEQFPNMQAISAHLDSLYGASMGPLVRKKGEVQTVGFFADFLSDELAPGGEPVLAPLMEFLGQVLLHPVLEDGCLREDFVQSEKTNLINAIEANLNEKRAYASQRLVEIMCSGEAYGVRRMGTADEVRAITAASLTEHWKKILATSRVEIFYLGTQPRQVIVPLLQKALAGLPRETLQSFVTRPGEAPETPREVQERLDVTQGKLCIGLRTDITCDDPRYPALVLMNAVFGACTTSKLFVHVREERSLCYYAGSSVEKFKGLMMISSGIEFAQFETARDEILRQLAACQAGEITDEELNSARQQIDASLRIQQDSPGSLDNFYVGQAIFGRDETMEDMRLAIAQVTKDEVAEAARSLKTDTIYFLKGVQA